MPPQDVVGDTELKKEESIDKLTWRLTGVICYQPLSDDWV